MNVMDKLKDAFDEAIQAEPWWWNAPVSGEPGAPTRTKLAESMFLSTEDAEHIEFIIGERIADGETPEDIVEGFVEDVSAQLF